MSLLMDALKKAEQAKQAGEAASNGSSSDKLRLEPIDAGGAAADGESAATTSKNLPELPAQLEVLDSEFMAHATSGKVAATGESTAAKNNVAKESAVGTMPYRASSTRAYPDPDNAAGERQAARQVFAAKHPPRPRASFALVISTVTAIAAVGIGSWVWWQMQPKSGPAASRLASTMPAATIASSVPLQPHAVTAPPKQVSSIFTEVPAPTSAATGITHEADEKPRQQAKVASPATPGLPAETSIRVTRSQLRLNPAVARAFQALDAGDLGKARTEYEKVLESEPRNGDALNAMAAIALRQGDTAAANEWYIKALEANPRDAVAQAGLVGLRGSAGAGHDAAAFESRIKSLIAAQPDEAALHFALGNIHARQSRWSDAQQSFFRAFSIEPENPDYVFNLAVSLDHLRQTRLAAQYYGQALALATDHAAGFDKVRVATRLHELQQ